MGQVARVPRLGARALATVEQWLADLAPGTAVTVTPVVDLARPGTHDVVGNRSFGEDPDLVIAMAREVTFPDGRKMTSGPPAGTGGQ